MSLSITNARVIEFYKNHQMLNVDTMNVLFVEILEKLFSEISPDMDNDFAIRLVNEMKNITSVIEKIQNDNIQNFTLKSIELKKEYINDLQMILNNNNTQSIKPLLHEYTEMLQDKTKIIIDDKFNNINTSIDSIKSINILSNERQIEIDKRVGEVLKKFDSSSKKGNMSEMVTYNLLKTLYSENQIKIVSTTKETGDILLIRENKPIIIIENKEYTSDVKQSEVDKFIRDMNSQNCSGIFVSQSAKIVNKNNFEIALYGHHVGVYIGNAGHDIDIIKIAIDIIDSMKSLMKDDSSDDEDDEEMVVSKEELDTINNEYLLFINNKTQHIKSIKDMAKKLIQETENLNVPTLTAILSENYGVNKRTEWACTICNKFIGKNKGSLAGHMKKHNKIGDDDTCKEITNSNSDQPPSPPPPPCKVKNNKKN